MNKKALYVPPVCEVNKVAVERNFLASAPKSIATIETMDIEDDELDW